MCGAKQMFTLLRLCVSSLHMGYANILCIVPMLTDDRKSPTSGPSDPRVGLDCLLFLLPPILPLPDLRRRLCVYACIRLGMFSLSRSISLPLSLSLSLLPLDVSVYLSSFSAHHPSNVSAKKQRQVQS